MGLWRSNNMGFASSRPRRHSRPKPSTVNVDSLIQSAGFLKTGYSGNFEPMGATPMATGQLRRHGQCALGSTVDAGDKLVYVHYSEYVNGRRQVARHRGRRSADKAPFHCNLAASDLRLPLTARRAALAAPRLVTGDPGQVLPARWICATRVDRLAAKAKWPAPARSSPV